MNGGAIRSIGVVSDGDPAGQDLRTLSGGGQVSASEVDEAIVNVQSIHERIKQREGAEAILRDRPLIARVRLDHVDVDTWGVTATVITLPTKGLWRPPKDRLTLRAGWQVLSLGEHRWSAAYCGWTLYFSPRAVRAVIARAKEFTTDIDLLWSWCETNRERVDLLMRRYANLILVLNESD
jgi:hypothetical protein